MKLAALIIRYWCKHTDEVDKITKIGWKKGNILRMLKWQTLYLICNVIAKLNGYEQADSMYFIKKTIEYGKEE